MAFFTFGVNFIVIVNSALDYYSSILENESYPLHNVLYSYELYFLDMKFDSVASYLLIALQWRKGLLFVIHDLYLFSKVLL